MKKVLTIVSILVVLLSACGDDDAVVITNQPGDLCDSIDVTYTDDIAVILENAGCSGAYCHGFGNGGFTAGRINRPQFASSFRCEFRKNLVPNT